MAKTLATAGAPKVYLNEAARGRLLTTQLREKYGQQYGLHIPPEVFLEEVRPVDISLYHREINILLSKKTKNGGRNMPQVVAYLAMVHGVETTPQTIRRMLRDSLLSANRLIDFEHLTEAQIKKLSPEDIATYLVEKEGISDDVIQFADWVKNDRCKNSRPSAVSSPDLRQPIKEVAKAKAPTPIPPPLSQEVAIPTVAIPEAVINESVGEEIQTDTETEQGQGTNSVEDGGGTALTPQSSNRQVPEGFIDGFEKTGNRLFEGLDFPVWYNPPPKEKETPTSKAESDAAYRERIRLHIVERIDDKRLDAEFELARGITDTFERIKKLEILNKQSEAKAKAKTKTKGK